MTLVESPPAASRVRRRRDRREPPVPPAATWASACGSASRSPRSASSTTASASRRRWSATRRSSARRCSTPSAARARPTCLNLAAAGLTADDRGRLKVNEFYQTEVPHIYAAGDVIGFPALAATSMEQGRLASCHMFHQLVEPASPALPLRHLHDPRDQHGRQDRAGADGRRRPTRSASPATARSPAASSSATRTGCSSSCSTPDPPPAPRRPRHRHRRDGADPHRPGRHGRGAADRLLHRNVFNYPTLAECYKVAALDGLNRVRPASQTILELPKAA